MNQFGKLVLTFGIVLTIIVITMNDWLGYLFILLLVFLIMYSGLIIHEAGHLVAGLLLRYKFLFMIIGPIVISNRDGNLTVTLNKSKTNWGQCVMMPIFNNYHDNRKRYLRYLAAGSIANLLTIFLTASLYFGTENLMWLLMASSHLFVGILAIVPLRADGVYYTDGLAIKILLHNDETTSAYLNLLRISYPLTFSTDLEKIDDTAFELIEKEWFKIADNPSDDKTHRELVTFLLYELVIWHFMKERYQRCLHLLVPFIENQQMYGVLKEELITSYLYSKLAVEHTIESPTVELTLKNLVFHNIPKFKIQAILYLKENQKDLALKTLKLAKNEIAENKQKLHSDLVENTVIDKLLNIIESY